MARVSLRLYVNPGAIEALINIYPVTVNDVLIRTTAIIDTGAAVSLFPNYFLDQVVDRQSDTETVIIEQAGIAQQSFQATKAFVRIFVEDLAGNRTTDLEIPAWFADTELVLLGFDGFLDRATLYINMRNAREGWIEMD